MKSWDNEGQGKERCEKQEIRISPQCQEGIFKGAGANRDATLDIWG